MSIQICKRSISLVVCARAAQSQSSSVANAAEKSSNKIIAKIVYHLFAQRTISTMVFLCVTFFLVIFFLLLWMEKINGKDSNRSRTIASVAIRDFVAAAAAPK